MPPPPDSYTAFSPLPMHAHGTRHQTLIPHHPPEYADRDGSFPESPHYRIRSGGVEGCERAFCKDAVKLPEVLVPPICVDVGMSYCLITSSSIFWRRLGSKSNQKL